MHILKTISLLGILAIFATFALAGCDDTVNMDNLYIGDTFTLWREDSSSDANIKAMDITYTACYAETIDDNNVLLCETLAFTVYENVSLAAEDFTLIVGYYQDDSQNTFTTSQQYNTEKNGYDITETPLAGDTEYTFCFVIPYEANGCKYSDKDIYFKAYGVYFVYKFN